MDPDEHADVFAIVGLAGAGLGLMLVGLLDLRGIAIVLAVAIPVAVAVLSTVVMAAISWRRVRHGPTSTVSHTTHGQRRESRTHGDTGTSQCA